MSTTCNDDKLATTSEPVFEENVWIVVPAYNEGERLLATRDNASDLAVEKTNVWVLRHPVNSGQGAALQTGIDFALERGAEAIVTFDGDGQHDVHDIDNILEPLRQGQCDVVLGSRFLGNTEGMPLSRYLVLKAAVLFTRIFSRIRVTDTHNGLRGLSRKAAKRIQITLNRMAHASEILDQVRFHDLRFRECPVTIRYNEHTLEKGQSSWNSFRIVAQLFMSKMMR
jgi:glycosyltransferase involved in cell wall biosynthesis